MNTPVSCPTKYVIVTGGVVSGLGKGIAISSLGVLLKSAGYSCSAIKIDPYLNCDAGTMSPFEHGEVFVLNDGGEVDLDLGNYERFLDVQLTRDNNITTGKIYSKVIESERKGDYLGKTVQIVPHITDCTKEWIHSVAKIPVDRTAQRPDICLIEVGGTVGDIESSIFLESIRQLIRDCNKSDVCMGFVSLVPVIGVVGEQKTKPSQHAVQELRRAGLFPDFMICRSENVLVKDVKKKLSLFCDIPESNVFHCCDCQDILEVPNLLYQQKILDVILNKLELPIKRQPDLTKWIDSSKLITSSLSPTVTIGIVGKYTGFEDSYLSVKKALIYAALETGHRMNIEWIDSCSLLGDDNGQTDEWNRLKKCNGVLVPGGFGIRGIEGMIKAITYARENKIPYLGICLGMQLAVIEYYRNKLHRPNGNSAEFDESCDVVVKFMPEINPDALGGTMRLGAKTTIIENFGNGDIPTIKKLYGGKQMISERHRHRYEVNPDKITDLHGAGMEFVGKDETGQRMEIIELPKSEHPYFIGTQFHPEFNSTFSKSSPPFLGLILASIGKLDQYLESMSHKI